MDHSGSLASNVRSSEDTSRVPGWTTETQLVRIYDRPCNVAEEIGLTITESIERWPELSETPPLSQFVDVEKLAGLFKTKSTDESGWLPSAEFQFQGCRVTVLYGSPIRIIVDRDP